MNEDIESRRPRRVASMMIGALIGLAVFASYAYATTPSPYPPASGGYAPLGVTTGVATPPSRTSGGSCGGAGRGAPAGTPTSSQTAIVG